MASLADIISGRDFGWETFSGVSYVDRSRKSVIFSSIIAVGNGIIQQFSSGGEFGGTFLFEYESWHL